MYEMQDAAVDAALKEWQAAGPNAQRELTLQTIRRMRGSEEAREGCADFLDQGPAHWTHP